MSGNGTGGGTSFENMSHEQMLAWLDQANAGTVQAAADRLTTAAKEIHRIAEELKIRPQWVEWKGEGADAFRAWTADLANATLRLGDFSEGAAKWLADASDAIARAQSAIPRDTKGAQANLDAATAAHNDPDAEAVARKSTSELEALAASREKVRQEAAAEMVKLGQSYELSATQMNGLERPRFPPPPDVILPVGASGQSSDLARPGDSAQSVASPDSAVVVDRARSRDTTVGGTSVPSPERRTLPEAPPTQMEIDSVAPPLPNAETPTGQARGLPGTGRVDSGLGPQMGLMPPAPGGGRGVPTGTPTAQGRSPVTGRMPMLPGQGISVPNPARVPGSPGIVGGRPVPPPSGGSTGAIPRGTVVGSEGMTARGPMGPTTGTTSPVGRAAGQPGQVPGRRAPFPNRGVVGGSPQQTGRSGSSPGSTGVTGGSGAALGGTTRSGVAGGASSGVRPGESRGTGGPGGTRPTSPSSIDDRSRRQQGRPVEDEQTWRQPDRRPVPPVID